MEGNFDVLIIGTGITESITAAALSKAGLKVAHIDENSYYGGDDASLTLDELVRWADRHASGENAKFSSVSCSSHTPMQSRHYSITLRPSIIPSIGPIISSLISSGVAKYSGFRLLERVVIYHAGTVKSVPGSKADIFKSNDISLIDKRRLMRFLMFVAGDFEDKKEFVDANEQSVSDYLKNVFLLPEEIISAVVYALSFSTSHNETPISVLKRIQRYMRSAGRYGTSPFLLGHYGGAGEIAQGFCRASAVNGGVYILGRRILSICRQTPSPSPGQGESNIGSRYSISLEDFPETFTARVIVSSRRRAPSNLCSDFNHLPWPASDDELNMMPVARCVTVIDQPISFPSVTFPRPEEVEFEKEDNAEVPESEATSPFQPVDAGILVFPPSSLDGGSTTHAATVLITGESTMSTPEGKCVLYISLPLSVSTINTTAQQVLQPYLDATLSLRGHSESSPAPLFTLFYIEDAESSVPSPSDPNLAAKTFVIPPPLSPAIPLPDTLDKAAIYAETTFWEVVHLLAGVNSEGQGIEKFWIQKNPNDDSDEEGW